MIDALPTIGQRIFHHRVSRSWGSACFGESAEALPVADEARRFRGSVPIGECEQRSGIG